jgi:hypothetical protein
VLQECKEELDDLVNRKCHDVWAENEQYKSINDELQQSLEESAAGFEEELAALEGENTRLAEDNEEQKKEIEALERELRKKQFSSLSNHDENPLEDFDCSKESVADEEWAGVSQVVENLKEQNTTETKRMTGAEQTLVQRNENQMKMMQILEDKFHTLKASTEKREAYLLKTIRRQKISIDSLYADLVCTKEQVTKLKEFAESPGQSNNGVDCSSSFTGDDDESKSSSKQADMLQSVMEKQSAKKQQQQDGVYLDRVLTIRATREHQQHSLLDGMVVVIILVWHLHKKESIFNLFLSLSSTIHYSLYNTFEHGQSYRTGDQPVVFSTTAFETPVFLVLYRPTSSMPGLGSAIDTLDPNRSTTLPST